jgi:hypothetical protein
MPERFGVARGLSLEDACARYTLHCLHGGFAEGTIFHPDPLDERACLAAVERDSAAGEWVLRFSWRAPPTTSPAPDSDLEV